MKYAIAVRKLQFTAGPQKQDFEACAEHRHLLDQAWPHSLFFSTADEPVRDLDPEDEQPCYFCQEG